MAEPKQPQTLKYSSSGVVLVPQPPDDPNHPLNWPLSKKVRTLAIVSLASFIGITQALTNQSGFFVQGALYHKTAVQMSYSISAAIVGLATGPLFWTPLSQRIGCSACIFWGMVGTLACCIWSGSMTSPNNYKAFVVSKWLGGTFGSVASTIGAGVILDIFFLHQRGKAFAFYTISTLFGPQVGPTFGGFIIESAPWSVQFWWVIGVEGLVILLVLLFLDETSTSENTAKGPSHEDASWLAGRVATIFPRSETLWSRNGRKTSWLTSIMIGLCPVSLLAGGFLMVAFGWAVAVTTLLPVFLQRPLEAGGYGFSPLQYAAFTFSAWIGTICAEIYGMLLNDRLPLWMCHRRGGNWKPEYRLYPSLVPHAVILPIGFGIIGTSLQYHLHYMVLALGVFLVNFCDFALVPIVNNYVVESFTNHPSEANTIMSFYRLILGLFVPFFIDGWEARVGAGWVFGMMAFFAMFAFSFTVILAWKGSNIRRYSFASLRHSEEGAALVKGLAEEAP